LSTLGTFGTFGTLGTLGTFGTLGTLFLEVFCHNSLCRRLKGQHDAD
jgi:hypothetical protein